MIQENNLHPVKDSNKPSEVNKILKLKFYKQIKDLFDDYIETAIKGNKKYFSN